jgi:hypothetical protein
VASEGNRRAGHFGICRAWIENELGTSYGAMASGRKYSMGEIILPRAGKICEKVDAEEIVSFHNVAAVDSEKFVR